MSSVLWSLSYYSQYWLDFFFLFELSSSLFDSHVRQTIHATNALGPYFSGTHDIFSSFVAFCHFLSAINFIIMNLFFVNRYFEYHVSAHQNMRE